MKVCVFFIALILLGCGGGDSSGANSSSSSIASSVGNNDHIDCDNLDPNKVYMLGTFAEGADLYAIADPQNPLDFCLGFDYQHIVDGIITESGGVIYALSGMLNIYSMVPEQLEKVPDESTSDPHDLVWKYPDFASANDEVLFTSAADGCGLGSIKIQPLTSNIYYSCPNRTINTELILSYYDIGTTSDNKLLTVLSDGALLVYTFEDGIKYVDKFRNETILSMPKTIEIPVCGSAKQFIDKYTGHQKVWLECYDYNHYSNQNENLHRRYTVNIEDLSITDDGSFAEIPQGARAYLEGKFDGQGNLWQVGDMGGDFSINVVIKRPLLGGKSTIAYSESSYSGTGNWIKDEVPFVRMENSSHRLITGY